MCTLRYLSGKVHDRADCPGGITLRHHFYAATRMELELPVIKGLVAEFTARKRVLFLGERTMVVLLCLDQSLLQSPRLTPTVSEVLGRRCRHNALPASHRMTETDSITGETTFWIYQNAISQTGSSFVNKPLLRSQPTTPSSMQMDPFSGPTSTLLLQTLHTVQFSANSNMIVPQTARESEHSIQLGTDRCFVDPVSRSSFLNASVPLMKLL